MFATPGQLRAPQARIGDECASFSAPTTPPAPAFAALAFSACARRSTGRQLDRLRELRVRGMQGLSARDIAMNVALPEVDGRILARAVSFKAEAHFDTRTECPIVLVSGHRRRPIVAGELQPRGGWGSL